MTQFAIFIKILVE